MKHLSYLFVEKMIDFLTDKYLIILIQNARRITKLAQIYHQQRLPKLPEIF